MLDNMIKSIAHICLNVSDINQSIDFYNKKLGFPIKFTFQKDQKLMVGTWRIAVVVDSKFCCRFVQVVMIILILILF